MRLLERANICEKVTVESVFGKFIFDFRFSEKISFPRETSLQFFFSRVEIFFIKIVNFPTT